MILTVAAALLVGMALALAIAALAAHWRIRVDLTPIEHAFTAVAVQGGWAFATGDWIAGGVMGVLLFVGREHAQAEQRYLKAGIGSLPPELGCLHPRYWDIGSVLDVAVPAAACIAIGVAVHASV